MINRQGHHGNHKSIEKYRNYNGWVFRSDLGTMDCSAITTSLSMYSDGSRSSPFYWAYEAGVETECVRFVKLLESWYLNSASKTRFPEHFPGLCYSGEYLGKTLHLVLNGTGGLQACWTCTDRLHFIHQGKTKLMGWTLLEPLGVVWQHMQQYRYNGTCSM